MDDKPAIHVFQFSHDHGGCAGHINDDRGNITFRSIVQQAIVDVLPPQDIYSNSV